MAKLIFDTTTCGRCGGTGRMPFAVADGRCFRCAGAGEVHTRIGANAFAKWTAYRNARTAIPIEQVTPGQHLRYELWSPSGSVRYTATVLEAGPDPLNAGWTRVSMTVPTRWQQQFPSTSYLAKGGVMHRPITSEDIRAFAAEHPKLKGYRVWETPLQ